MLVSLPYIIFFLFIVFQSIPINKNDHLNKNIQYYAAFIGFVFFIGLRGFIYHDWRNYYPAYAEAPSLLEGISRLILFIRYNLWEPGFNVYLTLFKTISSNYFFFQAVSFLIDIILLYIILKEYINNYIILGFVFFILFDGYRLSINLLRNMKGILLFLISIKYCINKRIIPYIFINIIGSLFHISSIIFIPLYFLLNMKYSRKLVFILFILGNVVFILRIQWIKDIVYIFGNTFDFRLAIRALAYINSSVHSISLYNFGFGFIERQLSFLLIFLLYPKLYKNNENINIFVNIFYIYCFIFLFCSEMIILFDRVAILFVCSYWIIYPSIYKIISKKYKYIFLILILMYGVPKINNNHYGLVHVYDNVLIGYKSFDMRLNEYWYWRMNESPKHERGRD